jgi:hypothetical protein
LLVSFFPTVQSCFLLLLFFFFCIRAVLLGSFILEKNTLSLFFFILFVALIAVLVVFALRWHQGQINNDTYYALYLTAL